MDETERIIQVTGENVPVQMTWHKDPTRHLLKQKAITAKSESVSNTDTLSSEEAVKSLNATGNYEYRGESFLIVYSEDGEIAVSDGLNSVSVKLTKAGPTLYKVSSVTGGWWWRHDTVEDAVNRACLELVKARKRLDPDFARTEMSEFMASLEAER